MHSRAFARNPPVSIRPLYLKMPQNDTDEIETKRTERRTLPSVTISLSHLPYYAALLTLLVGGWQGVVQVSRLVDAIHASTTATDQLQQKITILADKLDGLADRVKRLEDAQQITTQPARRP